ncbi:hypothetical protein F5H01DRAFT_326494 [Linnemannia elongata]|nr:hypothetical protein F5H01DRAFT_326494 [Linnemannia elongata]
MGKISGTTTGNSSNLGAFSISGSSLASQTIPIPIPKPPVPEVAAMPPNRSPAKILNKIRSNSSTTQPKPQKQARDCVEEFVNRADSLKNAVMALPKVQQILGNLPDPIIVMINSSRSLHKHNIPGHPKPKMLTAKAKKRKQAKNQTSGNESLPTTFTSVNNINSAAQTKSIAPIASTNLTTPAMPITPTTAAKPIDPPPKTKSEPKTADSSKSTAGSKMFSLTKNKVESSTSTPANCTPGFRITTFAKSAPGPKPSKPIWRT